LLPLGPMPFRVNLVSVVCHALTVGLVFFTAFRLTHSRPASAIAALLAHLMRKDYGTGQLISAPEYQGGSAVQRIAALLQSLGPANALLIALGAVQSYRWGRDVAWG
jgi:hypothetical protein